MIDWLSVLNLLKPLGVVTVSDLATWGVWALKNDGRIDSYELGVLGHRLLLYGGVAVSMTLFGASQNMAITAAGIGPIAEYLANMPRPAAPVVPVPPAP